MKKPLILIANDFKNELSELVNRYVNEVPAMFLADSIRDIYNQLDTISKAQLTQAEKDFESDSEKTESL